MGWFDKFKSKTNHFPNVLESLLEAAERRDFEKLALLCGKHQAEIRQSFLAWSKVPEIVRKDPAATNRYAQGLIAIAQIFENNGDASLLSHLMGTSGENPLSQWQSDLAEAQSLIGKNMHAEAIVLLEAVLSKNENLQGGTAIEFYLPRTLGILGTAYFRSGKNEKAIECMTKAKSLCEESGDAEGVVTYEGNLQHLAQHAIGGVKDPVEYTMADGKRTKDITEVIEYAKFKALDPTFVPEEAKGLHEQGRQYGAEGKFDLAIASFKQACEIAPNWAYPIYDIAYTLLLQGRQDEALLHYKRVDALEPKGFFTTKTAIWTLELESAGELPTGTYNAYLTLEDIQDRADRSTRAKEMWDRLPGFTPAFKDYVLGIPDANEKLSMIDKGLHMESDAETKGILMLNKATTLGSMGNTEEARRILTKLNDDDNETVFTRVSASELLKVVGSRK